jgi:hypothetical protein
LNHMRTYVESTASEREDMTETSTSSELGTTLKDDGIWMANGNGDANGGAAAARATPAVKQEAARATPAVKQEAARVDEVDEEVAGGGSAPVLLRAKTAPPRAEQHQAEQAVDGDEPPELVRAMSCLSGKFLLDGRTLQLPSLAAIGMEASLAQRVEALREFLEGELGDMPFIRCGSNSPLLRMR